MLILSPFIFIYRPLDGAQSTGHTKYTDTPELQ